MNNQDCPSALADPQSDCPESPLFRQDSLRLDPREQQSIHDTLREMTLALRGIESRLDRLESSLSKWL
jgi:hypothetical protein